MIPSLALTGFIETVDTVEVLGLFERFEPALHNRDDDGLKHHIGRVACRVDRVPGGAEAGCRRSSMQTACRWHMRSLRVR